jgi:hypothetical protein
MAKIVGGGLVHKRSVDASSSAASSAMCQGKMSREVRERQFAAVIEPV